MKRHLSNSRKLRLLILVLAFILTTSPAMAMDALPAQMPAPGILGLVAGAIVAVAVIARTLRKK